MPKRKQEYHIVNGSYGRDKFEREYNAVQFAGGRRDFPNILKSWGFDVVKSGDNGVFGCDTLMPGRMNVVERSYAYAKLPKGWQLEKDKSSWGEEARLISDDKGRPRIRIEEWYGVWTSASSPHIEVKLMERFNIAATDSGKIRLDDALTGDAVDLMDMPADQNLAGHFKDAVRHGLYKALVCRNGLSRFFTYNGFNPQDADLARLWNGAAPLTQAQKKIVAQYAQEFLDDKARFEKSLEKRRAPKPA